MLTALRGWHRRPCAKREQQHRITVRVPALITPTKHSCIPRQWEKQKAVQIIRTFILIPFSVASWQRRLNNVWQRRELPTAPGCWRHRHQENLPMESLLHPFTQHQSCDASLFLCTVPDHEAREKLSSRSWGCSFRKSPTPTSHRCSWINR